MSRAIVLGLALATSACWSASTTLRADLRASDDGGTGVDADADANPQPADDGGPTPLQDGGQDAPASDAAPVPLDASAGLLDAGQPYDAAPDVDGGHGEAGAPDAGDGDGCVLTQHTNGVGGGWTDCTPPYTWTQAEALAACKSWGGAGAGCWQNPACPYAITGSVGSVAISWGYAPGAGGWASQWPSPGAPSCPISGDAAWW